ncbi:MAG: phosphotransferase family protein [Candidatus Thorarchaeota archaeon]|jgi:aminoglycoside 2''-phosphotransferase
MYEETNPPDIDDSVVRAAVEKCFPHIPNPRVQFFYHGTYNVYLVEEEYLFRFPSTILPIAEQQRLVCREAALLERLQSHIVHEIPVPEFVDAESDHPFMGYKMIPGASLSRHFDATTSEQQRSLGVQVGTFLSQLHSVDGTALDLGEDGTYRPEESRTEFDVIFARVQDTIFPELSKQERIWTEELFRDFLDSDENFEFEPVLIHGDFDTSNILVDPKNYTVTGIIDFEETRVYDPAADLIFLREGVEFLTSLLHAYTGRKDPHLGQRVIFRLGRQPFIYILWGSEHGLDTMVTYGYATLRVFMKNWKNYVSVAKQCFND